MHIYLQMKDGLPIRLLTVSWQLDAGLSAIVNAHNDGHITVYEELDYSHNIGELSGRERSWGGGKRNPSACKTVS